MVIGLEQQKFSTLFLPELLIEEQTEVPLAFKTHCPKGEMDILRCCGENEVGAHHILDVGAIHLYALGFYFCPIIYDTVEVLTTSTFRTVQTEFVHDSLSFFVGLAENVAALPAYREEQATLIAIITKIVEMSIAIRV